MAERIVVAFQGLLAQDAREGAVYLERALRTKQQAEAHGATLCAWSAWSFAFALEADELEEALNLAVLAGDPDVGGAESTMAAGVSAGELSEVGERGSKKGLLWGLALVSAGALARAAAVGEVLIATDLYARRSSEIEALGFRGEGERIKRLLRPGATIDRASEPVSFRAAHRSPSARPPADAATETAKRALLQGDTASLERLIQELSASGEHADLVERMSGFVALRRGATAEALRRLRKATEDSKEPAQRARALLAYAVALASAGRSESALLEAVAALARAREAGDRTGEHASTLFLARLSAAAGHPRAASAWARAAALAEASQG